MAAHSSATIIATTASIIIKTTIINQNNQSSLDANACTDKWNCEKDVKFCICTFKSTIVEGEAGRDELKSQNKKLWGAGKIEKVERPKISCQCVHTKRGAWHCITQKGAAHSALPEKRAAQRTAKIAVQPPCRKSNRCQSRKSCLTKTTVYYHINKQQQQ